MQLHYLEKQYSKSPYPQGPAREDIARHLNLTDVKVQVSIGAFFREKNQIGFFFFFSDLVCRLCVVNWQIYARD